MIKFGTICSTSRLDVGQNKDAMTISRRWRLVGGSSRLAASVTTIAFIRTCRLRDVVLQYMGPYEAFDDKAPSSEKQILTLVI